MNSLETLKQSFVTFIASHFNENEAASRMDFSLNTDPQKADFGDINTNIALLLAKSLGKAPRAVAQDIIDSYSHPFLKKIEIAGPGFINFFLTDDAFKSLALDLCTQKDGFFKVDNPTTVYNVEFISANPTGPLHIGHGRGGIIGDVLSNVLHFLGYNTTREHYINDAGAQMEKLGNSLKIRCLQEQGKSIEFPEDGYHGEYLKTLAQECIKEYGNNVTEKDDQFFIDYGYDKMLKQLKNTVSSYNINFDVWFSERTLHPVKIEAALKTLQDNGHLYEKEGATWFTSTTFGDDKDRVLKKADGTFTYAAADAAYILDKAQRGAQTIIIILGQDHHSYPKRLNGIRQALGLDSVKLDCILYQLVSIKEDGELMKLSKRAGRIIELNDIVETVGTDIARFFYLNRKADAHLDFDIKLALSKTEENPVYYLQYAYVRTRSVLEKAAEHDVFKNISCDDVQYLTAGEWQIIKKIVELKTVLHSISTNYQVHSLAYYLLEVAHSFHNYYHHNRVIEPETVEQSRGRLLLTQLVKEQFDRCLQLMGLTRPEKM
ncbi:arginine--tRNA ligase [Candidatus Babeliales bacterium]|nr:arginine--tRNA ligase [Candidatus Babeliales bacterium]